MKTKLLVLVVCSAALLLSAACTPPDIRVAIDSARRADEVTLWVVNQQAEAILNLSMERAKAQLKLTADDAARDAIMAQLIEDTRTYGGYRITFERAWALRISAVNPSLETRRGLMTLLSEYWKGAPPPTNSDALDRVPSPPPASRTSTTPAADAIDLREPLRAKYAGAFSAFSDDPAVKAAVDGSNR